MKICCRAIRLASYRTLTLLLLALFAASCTKGPSRPRPVPKTPYVEAPVARWIEFSTKSRDQLRESLLASQPAPGVSKESTTAFVGRFVESLPSADAFSVLLGVAPAESVTQAGLQPFLLYPADKAPMPLTRVCLLASGCTACANAVGKAGDASWRCMSTRRQYQPAPMRSVRQVTLWLLRPRLHSQVSVLRSALHTALFTFWVTVQGLPKPLQQRKEKVRSSGSVTFWIGSRVIRDTLKPERLATRSRRRTSVMDAGAAMKSGSRQWEQQLPGRSSWLTSSLFQRTATSSSTTPEPTGRPRRTTCTSTVLTTMECLVSLTQESREAAPATTFLLLRVS